MYNISKKEESREKITICTSKDFEVSYFCGSGNGGQARNKVHSGVQIKHIESGAIGRSSDSRSQAENKKAALERLIETPQFKFWFSKKKYELEKMESLEESVEKDCKSDNLKFEIKNKEGKWEEVSESYFNSIEAKNE